ncbi:glycoside hydrolase family 3 C-terminal domain-containing protein [Silvibacterium dinghuense]|uniref:Glycoside hydrolase family 3 protein n=1 Tax=Silvibacterium dinghuense TaxID=1560006 RepID=A0A4Q1S9R0_9BACT|nr:glycoside hydrolase family 3 C-terminal domain-containing protein [Silvibacterium dinghuense]RXS93659.1 glycoside hydrolase family 3 protein [Silvibacterium dinghuense]GGH06549.1 glycoside hydrolase family 3 [Silvibacterium dinghuense]
MRSVYGVLFLAAALLSAAAQEPAYKNPALPAEERAADLVHRMTLEEKVGQMGSAAHAIPRLDVPAYNYWNEALHGVARSGYATMFPQAIGMAATWDAPLLHQVGDAIATEARAKNSEALRHGNHDIYFGLTFWSPNINIFRDPRWGRGQETYGEDPFLTGTLGVNFIRGLQGDDPHYYKVIATPKHFAVHSGPENIRHKFDVTPTRHDLWDTYLPQFRMAIVDGKADSIMCSYNAVDGAPACGSTMLLQQVLRQDWGFHGFVTSDCGAIDDFFKPNTHQTEPDAEHADRDALLAGTDTNCGATYEHLGDAVRQGLIQEADIDRSLIRLFTARMELGLFDPPATVPYAQTPFSAVHSPENVAVAQRTAEESMVLLKNDGILPLASGRFRHIAVVGPNAAMLSSLEGNYNGTPYDPQLPVDAIRRTLTAASVRYAPGAPFVDGFMLPVPRTMLHPSPNSKEEGLKAEYFASPSLSGTPLLTRIDPGIDFNWSGVNPLPQHPSTGFAVRWTGTLTLPAAGEYQFQLSAGPCNHCAYEQSYTVRIDGQVVTEAKALPEGTETGPVQVNGTTGLPQESHQQRPTKFAFKADKAGAHTIEVDFVRSSAEHGTGITLSFMPPAEQLLQHAIETARDSDLVIAMLGLTPTLEGEEMPINLQGFQGGDRTDVALPAAQEKLLEALTALGKPVVVVLLNGSALAVNFAEQHANAILEAWYPGEAGAQAIADTLTGANNPGGRLPITFYRSINDLPSFTDYTMKGRTYRYFAGDPLFGFGYGLSYTTFSYANVHASTKHLAAGQPLVVEADVTNSGKLAGDEVAQLYLLPPDTGNSGLSPLRQLEGFERVHLKPGETRHLRFTLHARELSEVDAHGARSVQAGAYQIYVGGSQPSSSSLHTQYANFNIEGSADVAH